MPGLSEDEGAILTALDGRRDAMVATLIQWSDINSGSRNLAGLETMRGLLRDRLLSLADIVEDRAADPVSAFDDHGERVAIPHGGNLLARKRPHANRRVMLTGHMDTVFAPDHPFQRCLPMGGDRLHGPGTADMKGGILIMLEALAALEAAGALDAIGWDVVLNADEEVSSLGSASLLRETARGCRVGMTFEPSLDPAGMLAGARPGSGNFSAVVRGRSAHAGRNPGDGRNAVVAAADLAVRLDGWGRGEASVSVNVARSLGGGAGNVVPDLAMLWWNMRPTDAAAQQRSAAAIDALVTQVGAAHDVAIDLSGGFTRPPKPMDPRSEALFAFVAEAGGDIGLSLGWQATGGVCDGNNIAAEGVAVVDTMGARGGAIHTDGEYLLIDSLTERAGLAALTLSRLAQGRLDGAVGW
ncbi:MAG: hydrolase [Sphingobium sp.]